MAQTLRPDLRRETQAQWPTFPERREKNGFLVLVKITTKYYIHLEILTFPAILVNQGRILANFLACHTIDDQ